jgi:hypothetical protein
MAPSCNTDQRPATLPNERDLDKAIRALSGAGSLLVTLQWRVQRIARGALVDDFPEYALVEGDEIPTFAHIGELYAFALESRSRLEEASRYLDTIEEKLDYLDTVRKMHAEKVTS